MCTWNSIKAAVSDADRIASNSMHIIVVQDRCRCRGYYQGARCKINIVVKVWFTIRWRLACSIPWHSTLVHIPHVARHIQQYWPRHHYFSNCRIPESMCYVWGQLLSITMFEEMYGTVVRASDNSPSLKFAEKVLRIIQKFILFFSDNTISHFLPTR